MGLHVKLRDRTLLLMYFEYISTSTISQSTNHFSLHLHDAFDKIRDVDVGFLISRTCLLKWSVGAALGRIYVLSYGFNSILSDRQLDCALDGHHSDFSIKTVEQCLLPPRTSSVVPSDSATPRNHSVGSPPVSGFVLHLARQAGCRINLHDTITFVRPLACDYTVRGSGESGVAADIPWFGVTQTIPELPFCSGQPELNLSG
jgi:hypothetical protein